MCRFCRRHEDPSRRDLAMGLVMGRIDRNGLPVRNGPRLAPAKGRILAGGLRVSPAVNRKLIDLHRHLGQSEVAKQEISAWGNAMIADLGGDLQEALPARLCALAARHLLPGGPVHCLSRAENL